MNDWFLKILKEMIKNNYCLTKLPKMRIEREKSSVTEFTFKISIKKSVFEDVLTDEEKSLLWLEQDERNYYL